jgi:glycosyltransferase involved in cell wall biosynthesis
MKTLVLTMDYSSIRNVAEDIAEVLRANGEKVHVLSQPFLVQNYDKLIIFVPFTPPLLNQYLSIYVSFRGKKFFYTTVDGVPNIIPVNPYLLREATFIPNSAFSAENLMKANVAVDIPVLHGINLRLVAEAEKMVSTLREKLNKDFPGALKIGMVTGTTKRKNVDLAIETFNVLNEKYPDLAKKVHFFVISHNDFLKQTVPANVHFVSEFGKRSRVDVLAFYGAMDLTFAPTGCEGFGMPILESMSMGTPVIHQAIPPLIEFSTWQYNFMIPPANVEEYYDKQHMQTWKIYRFNPDDVIFQIARAIDSDDLSERRAKLKEIAKKYDINLLYTRFL